MRKPREAPVLSDALSHLTGSRENFQKLVAHAHWGLTVDGKYLHWDELKYRTPPEGLSHGEWWAVLKMNRQGQRLSVPLADKDEQRAFSFVQVDPIPKRLHEIDLRAGGMIQMPDQVTNKETRDQYCVSSLIEEAITSSQLEGATTTREVAKEMLRTGRAPRDRSERMILNNFITMRRISALKDQRLTKDLIREVHELVTDETLDNPSAAGRFRTDADDPIAVFDSRDRILHTPPQPSSLEDRVQRICEFANETNGPFVHPVIKSIILHFMIGYDHPFVDGNGRTARALFYWSMLRHGYWLVEYISISNIVLKAPTQYAMSYLHTETDECDLTYFILYHLKVIDRALRSLHEYIGRKTQEMRRFEAELQGISVLNHRQRGLIRHAVRHPGKQYTVKEHMRSHNVSYETARTDLLDLERRNLLQSAFRGKKLVFTPQPQLMGRLASIGGDGLARLI